MVKMKFFVFLFLLLVLVKWSSAIPVAASNSSNGTSTHDLNKRDVSINDLSSASNNSINTPETYPVPQVPKNSTLFQILTSTQHQNLSANMMFCKMCNKVTPLPHNCPKSKRTIHIVLIPGDPGPFENAVNHSEIKTLLYKDNVKKISEMGFKTYKTELPYYTEDIQEHMRISKSTDNDISAPLNNNTSESRYEYRIVKREVPDNETQAAMNTKNANNVTRIDHTLGNRNERNQSETKESPHLVEEDVPKTAENITKNKDHFRNRYLDMEEMQFSTPEINTFFDEKQSDDKFDVMKYLKDIKGVEGIDVESILVGDFEFTFTTPEYTTPQPRQETTSEEQVKRHAKNITSHEHAHQGNRSQTRNNTRLPRSVNFEEIDDSCELCQTSAVDLSSVNLQRNDSSKTKETHCVCAIHLHFVDPEMENVFIYDTPIEMPSEHDYTSKQQLCTYICMGSLEINFKFGKEVYCIPTNRTLNKTEEALLRMTNMQIEWQDVFCHVYPGNNQLKLEDIISWINFMFRSIAICVAIIALICIYIFYFVVWKKHLFL